MILQIFIEFLLFFVAFGAILCVLKLFNKKKKTNQTTFCPKSAQKVLDLGFYETLRFAWKSRATLWDNVPPYERVLDLFKEHSAMLRMRYLLNWSSAGRLAVIKDLDTIKHVLRSSNWLNRFQEDHYVRLGTFGKPLGILMGSDLYWKEARTAVMTAFRQTHLFNIEHIQGLYQPEIKLLLEKLRLETSPNTGDNGYYRFSPNHMFDYPIIHVAFKFIFGRRLLEKDPLEGSLVSQLNHNNSIFSLGFGAFEFFPFFKYFPYLLPTGRAYLGICRTVNMITALARKKRTKESSKDSCPQDIMDSLLKTVDEHAGSCPNYFTFENLQVTIRDLIFAGSDTTNVTLQHMILFMAAHQDKQEKVYAEIERAVGHDRWPTYADRSRMVYTQAMLLETLRLSSIAPVSLRINNKDCTIADLTLEKGTYLVPAFIGCHRGKDLWQNPLEFQPERFISDDNEQIVNTDKILPFSYGPRACPGELNGRIGLFMFTVALLREFKWELSDIHPPPPMLKGMRGLTRAPVPFYVRICRRNVVN